METIQLPDGTTIQIPSDTPPEERQRLALALYEKFQAGPTQAQTGPDSVDPFLTAPPSFATEQEGGLASLQQMRAQLHSRPREETEERPEEDIGEGGTLAGSALQGLKNIPKGVRQFGLMALAGIEGLRTVDEDTQLEKDIRQKKRQEDMLNF